MWGTHAPGLGRKGGVGVVGLPQAHGEKGTHRPALERRDGTQSGTLWQWLAGIPRMQGIDSVFTCSFWDERG